jgi:Mn-dependent DtxR family transcriptional regulator
MLKTDVLTREELQARLGKNPKITSTRLGELVKSEIAEKTGEGGYRITSFGVFQVQKEWLPKIKAKIGL